MPQISIIKKSNIQEARRFDAKFSKQKHDLDDIAFAFEKWARENRLSFWR